MQSFNSFLRNILRTIGMKSQGDPSCKDGNARFSSVPNNLIKYVFISVSYSFASYKQEMHKNFCREPANKNEQIKKQKH